jgi:hypothetical protein
LNQWLQVTLESNANTALTAPDVFYFGSRVGDSGEGNAAGFVTTSAADEVAARNHPAARFENIPVTNLYDFNRDGQVNATDQLAARRSGGSLPLIRIAPATLATTDAALVAAALTSSAIRAEQPLAPARHEAPLGPNPSAAAVAFEKGKAIPPGPVQSLQAPTTNTLNDCIVAEENEWLEGLWPGNE